MEWQGDFLHDHTFVELPVQDMLGGLGEADLQLLIRETEEKLQLNACSIEQNLRELQAKIGEAWTGEKVPSATECLQRFSQRNLAVLKPVSTGHQELLDFLKSLQHLLKTKEAHEEAVLQLLLNISSRSGVAFPSSGSLTEQNQTSITPFCSVHDNLALEVQEAWDDVRLHLRRHLLGKLSTEASKAPQKILILQQLCFLYPESDVVEKYRVLRKKAVLELLERTRSCTNGETGFERLALVFQAASTDVCGMLTEDVQVLNGIAKQLCILDYLNQTYLSTMAQELGLLMEEVEATLRDRTMHGGRSGRSSSKKTTVAPQDLPEGVRNFNLTFHQLRCLTQLASTLLELERRVEHLATELGHFNHPGDFACGLRGLAKKDDSEMPTVNGRTSPDLLLQSTKVVCLEFEWRAAFRALVPQMVHCVKVVLEEVCRKSLQQEKCTHTSGSTIIPLVQAPFSPGTDVTCSERDLPRRISKFCADIMEEMDALLPLAVACKDEALRPVRFCFVEVCGQVSLNLLTRLEERASEVPHASPLKNLPTLLASSSYINHRLVYYQSQLGDTGRTPLTLLPIPRSREVTEAIREHLTDYCVNVCATSILQDAESHYWADDKPFYEGERCSFSIQMWHYFLSGLRSDLWCTVSPLMAQQILAQVLARTLELLLQRYSRAQPSFRRLAQIRLDITAILQCVEQLMWSVCGSVEELIRPNLTSGTWVSIIHSLCNQLLNVLVILTAPLPEVYRTFQSKCVDESLKTLTEAGNDHPTFWLNIINPTLFPQDLLRDGVESECSAVWMLNLLSSGPGCGPSQILEAVLHRDCLLLRTLISHSYLCVDSGVEVSPEDQNAGAEFVEAIFTVLSSLNNFPRALTLVLEDYLDKKHLWDHFYSLADVTEEEPALFKRVRCVLYKPINSLIRHLVNMMQACEDLPIPLLRLQIPESVQAKIPKEWKYTPQENRTRDSSKNTISLIIQALSFIFTHLPSCVPSVPLPVRFLFHMAEKHLSQHTRQLKPTGLLIWTLLSCLCRGLEDGENLELVSAQSLERGVKERLELLSECLRGSLGTEKGILKPSVKKILQGLEERGPKWSSTQLQKARKLCAESVFRRMEKNPLQDGGVPSEPPEQKIMSALLALCQLAGGIQNLQQIHHTIQLNEDLLRSRLTSAVDRESIPEEQSAALFSAASAQSGPPVFKPLFYFNHIGQAKFDQASMSEREWDWARLLPAYQRLSQVTFTDLLANRWEMQDNSPLEDEEKIFVDHLKKTYLSQAPESSSE
ncbi:uncharacterized protein KIAA0825 homolog [Trichomycterus rosablanca]|uniref:uncharacterized protein KIAA0825 homolog n=1 Tax=Trichomycterus rosablanca TaxID=2290929 RepID=UPI002F354299